MENLISIRGATSIKNNSANEIKAGVIELLKQIIEENNLKIDNMVNIIFTSTHDLNAIHPATVAREEFKFSNIPMLCAQEMKVPGDLERCIRVMIQVYANIPKDKVKHIYLREAAKLRPDLV